MPREPRKQTEALDRYGGKLQLARKNCIVSRLSPVRCPRRRWTAADDARRPWKWQWPGRLLPAAVRLSRRRDESPCQLLASQPLGRARLAECAHRNNVSTLRTLVSSALMVKVIVWCVVIAWLCPRRRRVVRTDNQSSTSKD